MNNEEFKKRFLNLKNKLDGKKGWHREKMKLAESEHLAKDLGVSLPNNLAGVGNVYLSWGEAAIKYTEEFLQFDAFKNDQYGATRLLVESNAESAISSAIKNSLIGAVSFIAIFPRDIEKNELPNFQAYSGSQATAEFDHISGKLEFGIAERSYSDMGICEDYFAFLPGKILIVNASGEIDDIKEFNYDNTLMIPFINSADQATKPFGYSMLTKAATSAINSASRAMKLREIGSEYNIAQGHLILSQGAPIGDIDAEEQKSKLGQVNIIGSEKGTLEYRKLETSSISEVDNTLRIASEAMSTATGVPVNVFNVAPTSGGWSKDAFQNLAAPFKSRISKMRAGYGKSVEQLAVIALELLTNNAVNTFSLIQTSWDNSVPTEEMGRIGDALFKINEAMPGTLQVQDTREMLGFPIRPNVIQQNYPEFTNDFAGKTGIEGFDKLKDGMDDISPSQPYIDGFLIENGYNYILGE